MPLHRRALLAAAALSIVACAIPPDGGEAVDRGENPVDTGVRRGGRPMWGVVSGGIARRTVNGTAIAHNLLDEPERVACDMRRQLGFEWMRLDVDHNTDATPEELREIIRRAHARSLKVMVLAHPGREDAAASHQGWVDSYTGKLNALIDDVFTGDAVADAYELGNEPNDADHEGASPVGYADLLVKVWKGVKSKARANPPFIVSGGILSTYFYPGNPSGESWWTDFMAALPPGQAPWDAFGVHPYNPYSYSEGEPRNRAMWRQRTHESIHRIQAYFRDVKGYGRQSLWATEVGFRSTQGGINDSVDEADQASLFSYVDDTLAGDDADNHVDHAFWYAYRDNEGVDSEKADDKGSWGLRHDSASAQHAATGPKASFTVAAYRLGGEGSLDEGACFSSAMPPSDAGCTPDPTALVDCGPAAGKSGGSDDDNGHCAYFAATKSAISGKLYTYWKNNGGLTVFGYPKSPARCMTDANQPSRGLFSQWFERQRMEYHDENAQGSYEVLLGLLGVERRQQLGIDPGSVAHDDGPKEGCRWFEATKLNVCNQDGDAGFMTYWQTHGLSDPSLGNADQRSLALFGFPLTQPTVEQTSDGKSYLVQWFERARFEWHPEIQDAKYRVLLGLLGNEVSRR
ncbi:MAG: hypothetical protein ABJE95_02820 [Byssovorax sp.]